MKTKTIWESVIALALVFALLACVPALGEARYPEASGVLTDDANALSQSTAQDIDDYADKVESAVSVNLHVALVLFLDGETAQTYADTLFTRWELGDDDLLLLGAAAEDTFAVTAGDAVETKLSANSLKSLLYSSGFSDAFTGQKYDAAFGLFFVSFNDLLEKKYDTTISLGNLFADYQTAEPSETESSTSTTTTVQDAVQDAVQSVVDSTSKLWTSSRDSVENSVQDYQDYYDRQSSESGGFGGGGWIVLVLIALILFGQGRAARHGRENSGCGCSPIGWIIGGLGLGSLFNRRRGGFDGPYGPGGPGGPGGFGGPGGPGGFGRPPRR
jgi:hypothetical protein